MLSSAGFHFPVLIFPPIDRSIFPYFNLSMPLRTFICLVGDEGSDTLGEQSLKSSNQQISTRMNRK